MRIDPWTYWTAAVLLLLLPLKWLLAALIAAAVHELGHMLAVKLLGGNFRFLRISPGGMRMDVQLETPWQELLAAIAGPGGSFLLASLWRWIPEISICAGIQGLYNMLPIFPLDGGRALRCLLKLTLPKKAEQAMFVTEGFVCLLMLALGIWAGVASVLGWMPLWIAMVLILRSISRKRPCKEGRIRVQ